MYHLAKSLYLRATSKEEYSVVLLGLDNAGKTTLLETMKRLTSPTGSAEDMPARKVPAPTVGQNVATLTLPSLYLRIWDVGGQPNMRKLWQSYYTSCHAIVFVVDSTAPAIGDADIATVQQGAMLNTRLDECRQVLESVLQHSDAEGVPLLVLANKQDRDDFVEVVRVKEGFVRKVVEGESGGALRDSRVLPVSALNGNGVVEAIEWLKTRVEWNKEARPPVMR